MIAAVLSGCSPAIGAPSGTPAGLVFAVHGRATAGPTCPVEPASPLPSQCAPRPVAGAVLVITDAASHEVARPTTMADGSFSVDLPVGSYTLTPQAVDGVLGVAPPITFSVTAAGASGDLFVQYDSGIR